MSGPSSKPAPKPVVWVPHPDDLEEVRAAFEEVERGETISLTAEELKRWAEIGYLPEHVDAWTGNDESTSRPAT